MTTEKAKSDDISWEEFKPQAVKLALELGPLVVFFVANALGDRLIKAIPFFSGFDDPLYPATFFFMIAMVVSLVLSKMLLGKIAVMPLVTAIGVLIFGALTFYFHDTTFIKMKPTFVNALFGFILLGGLLFRQSLLKYVFGEVYKLEPQGWFILTVRWGIFFFVLAALNEIVWRMFPDYWVTFKVWATMPLTVIFAMFQLPVLTKYAPPAEVTEAPGA
ncbi:MAG TPA: septation protein A [Devosiaceae bacterium]|jgi:intracellular septation protein